MKLLVLDMDGVVNSNILIRQWLDNEYEAIKKRHPEYTDQKLTGLASKKFKKCFNNSTELIFPELAKRITEIVTETGCKILWSSTWRTLPKYKHWNKVKTMFDNRGLPGDALIGSTPVTFYPARGMEIDRWCTWYNSNNEDKLEKVAVIDDCADAGILLPDYCKFFQTNEETGITEELKKEIITWLK